MTMLFPFVYFMVKDFGVEESEIGYCVGFIASAFSCAQFVTAYFWGKLSDKYGRRPILLAGLLGNTATMLAFGCSKSLAWAITSRALCGLLNGNVGVAKCVLGEISDKTNRHRAFALIGFNFGLGMIIGPILGGLLDHPTRFALFAGSAFLSKYPYFLPCFVGAMISFTGFVVGWFFLPETSGLAVPEIQTAELVNETTGLLDPSVNSLLEENYLGTFEESTTTRSPPIKSGSMGAAAISSAIAYGLLAFQNIIFMEVFPLWAVATPGIGLGYSSSDIGLCLAGIGIFSLLCQLLIYPKLAATITPLHMFQYSALGMVFFFALVPLASSIFAVNPRLSKLTGVYIAASLAFKTIMENFLFTSLMLLVHCFHLDK